MYTFIKNEEGQIFAIGENRIETLRESQTYDRFGQKVGTYNTGDSVWLKTQKAVDVANRIAEEQGYDDVWKINDSVNGHDNSGYFDELEEALEAECNRDDFELNYSEIKGFDYWDGSNWKTIVTDTDTGYTPFSLIEDEKETTELNNAIENMEWFGEGQGSVLYKSGKYNIVESHFQSAWERYEISVSDEF